MNICLKSLAVGEVLVVDDTPANLHFLETLLVQNDYKVRTAINGKAALTAIAKRLPDIILLDARMPILDGYEVCRQLKAKKAYKDIPVIFISALNQTADKIKAFEAGGVDYVTKPFQNDEVLARVSAHLQIQRLRYQMVGQNARLERMVEQRTHQLREANDKLLLLSEAKSDFLTLISHELRTPLHGLLGATELVFFCNGETTLLEDAKQLYEASRKRMMGLIDNALLLSEMQVKGGLFASNSSCLDDVIAATLAEATTYAQPKGVKIIRKDKNYLGQVIGDWVFLKKALNCLIETAIDFSKPHAQVEIHGHFSTIEVYVDIESHGNSIPKEDLPRFFEVLSISKSPSSGGDLGLAPSVAERIISLLGGKVRVQNLQPSGIRFQACLPRLSELLIRQ